jgi:hypothetical protein
MITDITRAITGTDFAHADFHFLLIEHQIQRNQNQRFKTL